MSASVYTTGGNVVHPRHQSPSTQLLNLRDRTVLQDRAITAEVAAQRGYRTISATEATRYGFPALPGLLIPSHNTAGEVERYQLRPHEAPIDPKSGKPRKYLWPSGTRQSIDVPPASLDTLRDPHTPAIITESALKADAILSAVDHGTFLVMAVAGVYGWRSAGMPLSDFGDIPWRVREGGRVRHRRRVYIAFDSDAATNPNVARARWELGQFLSRRGADVWYIDVPGATDGGKQGIDDALAAGHTMTELVESAYRAPEAMPQVARDLPAGDLPEVERLRHEVATLRAELAEAQALQSATMALLKNPELKPTEKMIYASAVTLAAHKASRGEVEPDGRVILEPRHIANDHRPVAPKGESGPHRNPQDGSKSLTKRGRVKGIMQTGADRGLFDGFEILDTTRQDPDGRWRKYPLIAIEPSNPLEAIRRLAEYTPEEPTSPKPYTRQKPCRSCGKVHPRTRHTICNGCGTITKTEILPVPEHQRPGTAWQGNAGPAPEPGDITEDPDREDNTPEPTPTNFVGVESDPPSGPPSTRESTKFVRVESEPESDPGSTSTKNVKVNTSPSPRPPVTKEFTKNVKVESEPESGPDPEPEAPDGRLFTSTSEPDATPPGAKPCVLCGDELAHDENLICRPCGEEGARRNDERWRDGPGGRAAP